MPGYPDCLQCPFRGDPDRTCAAYAQGTRRVCEVLEHAQAVRDKVVADTLADPAARPKSVLVVTGDTVTATNPMSVPRPIDLASIKACPDRGEKIGDGCNCLHRCGRGYGNPVGQVSLIDCQDCLDGHPTILPTRDWI